jgi:hypothetical protein
MGIPKLPVRVSVFCNRRKEPRFIHTVPRGIYTDFVIRGGDYRDLRREWIDSQVLAPVKLHVVYGAREILNSRRCGCAVREHQVFAINPCKSAGPTKRFLYGCVGRRKLQLAAMFRRPNCNGMAVGLQPGVFSWVFSCRLIS